MNANVRSFAGRRPAWWGLGIQKPEGWGGETPVTDAMHEIKAIVDYSLMPVYITVNGVQIELSEFRALVRADDGLGAKSSIGSDDGATVDQTKPNVLQIVGKDYQIVQPTQFAASLDPVGRVLPVQTLGVLDKGSRYWVCFGGEDYEFQGDPFNEYLIASDDHQGGALRIYRTDVQVVCQNTWNMSLTSARSLISIPHSGSPADRLNYLAQLQVAIVQSRREMLDQFEALVNFKLTNQEDVAQIIEAAFPDPEKSGRLQDYEEAMLRAADHLNVADEVVARVHEGAMRDMKNFENVMRRTGARRVVAAETYARYNDEKPSQFAATAYNLVGAIIEDIDFGGVTMPGTPKSVLFGPRAAQKASAIDTALKLAGYKRQSAVAPVSQN